MPTAILWPTTRADNPTHVLASVTRRRAPDPDLHTALAAVDALGEMTLTNSGRMLGGVAGVLLVIFGSILLGQGGGRFLVGLVVVLVGVGLAVRSLLQLTEAATAGGNGTISVNIGGSSRSHDVAPSRGAFFSFKGMKIMSPTAQWTAGAIMGIVALLGLFLFSRAGDGMFALFGGVLFLFGLAVIVVFVHQATDYSSPAEPAAQAPEPKAATAAATAEEAQSAA
jgi:hypothetical protein